MSDQIQAPAALLPGKERRYPLHRELSEPHTRSGWFRSRATVLPGFEPRTVQSVASRYTIFRPFRLRDKQVSISLSIRKLLNPSNAKTRIIYTQLVPRSKNTVGYKN